MIFIGIDPGLSGALAFWEPSTRALAIFDMPTIDVIRSNKKRRQIDTALLLSHLSAKTERLMRTDMRAAIELSGVRPGEGAVGAHRNGINWGVAYMALVALKIPHEIVSPQMWKHQMRAPADKTSARLRASELMPEHAGMWPLKKHDGRAEAAMIAMWCANCTDRRLSGAMS